MVTMILQSRRIAGGFIPKPAHRKGVFCKMECCMTTHLFDLSHTLAAPLLENTEYPWEALDGLSAFLYQLGENLPADEYDQPQPGVWVAKDAKVAPTALLSAPCIIGHGAEVRHGALRPRPAASSRSRRSRYASPTSFMKRSKRSRASGSAAMAGGMT